MYCKVCGPYDNNDELHHDASPRHISNVILHNYKKDKKTLTKNRDGLFVVCNGISEKLNDAPITKTDVNVDSHKIRLNVKPYQDAKFEFNIRNDMKDNDVIIVGVQLAHPQPQFEMKYNPYIFGQDPHWLGKKSSIPQDVTVSFKGSDIGCYEMPIIFTFHKPEEKKNIIIIREMMVNVQENPIDYVKIKHPYKNEPWGHSKTFKPSTRNVDQPTRFKIPSLLKILLPYGLEEDALDKIIVPEETREQLRVVLNETRAILDENITQSNYIVYFHHLLWWEEIKQKINLRKYNMFGVPLVKFNKIYILEVPGLAEKRPSLLRGDRVFIRPQANMDVLYESTIKEIQDAHIHLHYIDESFHRYYSEGALFDVRFFMSRMLYERKHEAIHNIFTSKHQSKVFPEPTKKIIPRKPIDKFFNKLIESNPEQHCAVEHIVSGTSGTAPYIVFGPPGTGKTMTIVEAIIQLVLKNPNNRILVCTESNMAADHIAVKLLSFNKQLNINNFLVRANSRSREWKVLPAELIPVSNGSSYEDSYSLSNNYIASYRIVVTTLMHSAKYAMAQSQAAHRLQMSHVFVDEAGQAGEPAALVPVAGLLRPGAALVLAGDPQQLGPVCLSREASDRGLGVSLLQRLVKMYPSLYENNPNYITMLRKNFRSHPDILTIPNKLFYDNQLQACAPTDPLSTCSILGTPEGGRAIVFHAVYSGEQRMGNTPSFYNEKELDMLKRYVKALIEKHRVELKDIGIIAPYIRQVYKMRMWLTQQQYNDIEVGTVEAFQGKEKRVILVSTVRANCRLLDYDAKYSLGFLVDNKRYNVAMTRAKAKLIIIGNPTCLTIDSKWKEFMSLCEQFQSYLGQEFQQIERNLKLIQEITTTLEKCKVKEALDERNKDNKK